MSERVIGEQVVAVSRDGIFCKIGEDRDHAMWYKRGEGIRELARGEEVSLEYDVVEENGRKTRVIKSVSDSIPQSPSATNNTPSYNSSNNRASSIERQALMKASCDAVKAMTGQFNSPAELAEAIIVVFNKLNEEFYRAN